MNNKIKAIRIGTAIVAFAGAVAYATAKAATRKMTDLAESVVENLDDMFGVHTNLLKDYLTVTNEYITLANRFNSLCDDYDGLLAEFEELEDQLDAAAESGAADGSGGHDT